MSRGFTTRRARRSDLSGMVSLVETHRLALASYEPTFWRKAAASRRWTRLHFGLLLIRRTWAIVAECDGQVCGFLIAIPQRAPPVFDPGMKTALIDDFCIAAGADYHAVATALFDHVRPLLRDAGFGQLVVISAVRDEAKSAFLRGQQIHPVSQWSVGSS